MSFVINPISTVISLQSDDLVEFLDTRRLSDFVFDPVAHAIKDLSEDMIKIRSGKKPLVNAMTDFKQTKHINGMHLVSVGCNTRIEWASEIHYVSESQLYGKPLQEPNNREAMVQRFGDLDWMLIETSEKARLTLNFDALTHPSDCYFLGGEFQNLSQKIHNISIEPGSKILLGEMHDVKFCLSWRDKIITL
ncbi:MAG: hypothetical protein WDO15_22565 [Bacteroidota bacterium]